MTSPWQLEVKMKAKKLILRPEMNPPEVSMKYDCLVVFRYELKLVIGTLKIMASTGVFVRVVCSLKHSVQNFP
jgi:hypothetical protein